MRRILAIGCIFVFTSLGWMILAGSVSARTEQSGDKLRAGVSSTWGTAQEQAQPVASIVFPAAAVKPGDKTERTVDLAADRTRVQAAVDLDYRQKGLLWYSTYVVRFEGSYVFRNPEEQAGWMVFTFSLPSQSALYDDLTVTANGHSVPAVALGGTVKSVVHAESSQSIELRAAYRSQGLDSWKYSLGKSVTETRDFQLTLAANFKEIDFPVSTLSPTSKLETRRGWELVWSYRNLISGFAIGVVMPEKLQPGPVTCQISAFAPVSLLLFFFVMWMITSLRKIELHPMNYFFLAAAFFAFHLLMAYLVDHVAVGISFFLASFVSVGLVVSYLRLVLGARFALVEAGIAQVVYLVLFSSTFFLKGYTGLAVTLGSIATLFAAMQLTGRVEWREQFRLEEARR